MDEDLKKFYELVEEIEVAMLTTRRSDGHLRSRAMATQRRADGADLWFVTTDATAKVEDISGDPHVNLSFYKDRTREWISVSGLGRLSRDRQKIHELYAPDWKAWFAEEGDPRHGTKDDPRMVLIGVDIHAATYLEVDTPQPIVIFELVKGWVTGKAPELGELREIRK